MNMTVVSMVGWAVTSLLIAVGAKRARTVYWSGVLLSVPSIIISQLEYELLPMAGIVHAFCSGIFPFLLFAAIRHFRRGGNEPRAPN
jgi:hypothetical protein